MVSPSFASQASTPPTKAEASVFRADINGLRAVAVLAVVLYHFQFRGFRGGFVGVDVFFVISGFLMTQIIWQGLEEGKFNLWQFYQARARRIIPPLVTVVAATAALCGLFLMPGEYKRLSEHALGALTFVSNVVFAHEAGYFDSSANTKWLLHTWSLSVEWQFYIFFPIVLASLHHSRWRQRAPEILLGLGLVSLALCAVLTRTTPPEAFYLPHTRCWEFLAGSMVYFFRERFAAIPKKTELGLLVIIGCVAGFDHNLAFPGIWAVLPVAGATLIIADAGSSRLLYNRYAQWIGSISYSLYLWHWPAVVALAYTGVQRESAILGCIVAAWLSHRYVEVRFQRGRRSGSNLTRSRPRVLPAYLAVIACVMAISLTDGLPMRAFNGEGRLVVQNEALSRAWQYPHDCGSTMSVGGKAVVKYCTLGATSEHKVLVWGDSHAEHLYPAFSDIVERRVSTEHEIVFGTYGGCLPVRELDRPHTEGAFACADFNEQVYRYAQRHDIDEVIISSIWSAFFSQTTSGHSARQTRICKAPECRPFPTVADSIDFVRVQMEHDVGALMAQGKRVVIVLPIPVYKEPIAVTLARAQWDGREIDLSQTRTQHRQSTMQVRALLEEVANKTGAQLMDPAGVLCPHEQCLYAIHGVSLYKDRSHLTADAARMLSPMLASVLVKEPQTAQSSR